MDEDRLLAELVRGRPSRPGLERVGPGDDAAVLRWRGELVLTTDGQVEGVHFRRAWVPPRAVGYRAGAAALSDLAAMGAEPRAALAALVVPTHLGSRYVRALQAGLVVALKRHETALVGGNLVAGGREVSVTVTAVGTLRGAPLRRRRARPGDRLWLSGPTGRAALGRHLLARGLRGGATRSFLRPEPRLRLGAALRRRGLARGALDVSDGLLVDLARLLPPGLGAVLEWAALRPPAAFRARSRALGLAPEALVLAGGEDYELLWTSPPQATRALERLGRELGLPLRCIGRVTEGGGLQLLHTDGRVEALAPAGHRHAWPAAPPLKPGKV